MSNIIRIQSGGGLEIELVAYYSEWDSIRSVTLQKDYKACICALGAGARNNYQFRISPTREQTDTKKGQTSGYGGNCEFDCTVFHDCKTGDVISFTHSPGPYYYIIYGIN